TVVEYVGAGLRAGAEVIAVITEAHRAEVEEGLRSDGLDLDTACAGGQYLALDAAETLALIMADGRPSPARFEEVIGTIFACAATAAGVVARSRGGRARAGRDGRAPFGSDGRIVRRRDHRQEPRGHHHGLEPWGRTTLWLHRS